jgi:cytochrome c peroxidase
MKHLGPPALLLALLLVGCERAHRYGAAPAEPKPPPPAPDDTTPRVQLYDAWLPTSDQPDIPITFVEARADPAGWKNLKHYWNHLPGPAAGMRTAHLGQSPLGAVVALAASYDLEKIHIKVPLGLPDPTPLIPPANALTYRKWRLGQKLFFDATWLDPAGKNKSCASCHKPESGFTESWPLPEDGKRNTPSLINCVYNRHQFWDGRAEYLEEVIQRQLADESPSKKAEPPAVTHVWGGVVGRLAGNEAYREEFLLAFGVTRPTQDTIGKAIACFMRTLLSGNSVYDRAERERGQRNAKEIDAGHFAAALDAASLKALGEKDAAETGKVLLRGFQLHKKHCAACHPESLFTDHDFHNVGVGDSDTKVHVNIGKEFGRFLYVPTGVKELRLIGAYKTPTLRNLPRTAPYMHDGSLPDLPRVVKYFNEQIRYNPYLAPRLLDGPERPRHLGLTEGEAAALTLFLRALDGEAIDPILATPPK